MSPLQVLIADDHQIVRRGVAEILADMLGSLRICEAGTGAETLRLAREQTFDVILLDINLPDQNGLAVLAALLQARPEARVVILSIYPEDEYAIRAFQSGAYGYLSKRTLGQELTDAVRTVAAGTRYITPAVGQALAQSEAARERRRHLALSNRERQILCELGAGRTVGEIAQALGLSAKTVSTYRARLLEKLGLSTTAQLVHYAVEHKLLEHLAG